MPANFKTAVTYCKSRHPVGSDEFDACYAKQTGPNANHSFINSRKNRKNTRKNRKNRRTTRKNRRN